MSGILLWSSGSVNDDNINIMPWPASNSIKSNRGRVALGDPSGQYQQPGLDEPTFLIVQ